MHRCPEARELLPAYVENELSPVENSRLAGHLSVCPDCRREEAHFRRALGYIGSDPIKQVERAGDLYTGFAAKLEAANRRPLGRPRLQWAVALASLAVVVVAGAGPVANLLAKRNAVPAIVSLPAIPRREIAPSNVSPKQEQRIVNVPQLTDRNPDREEPSAPTPTVTTNETGQGNNQVENPITENRKPEGPVYRHNKRGHRIEQQDHTDFMDVRDDSGRSLRDRLKERTVSSAQGPSDNSLPSVKDNRRQPELQEPVQSPLVPVREERVQVGNRVTKVKTGYREDAEGNKTGIEINISTFSGPGK